MKKRNQGLALVLAGLVSTVAFGTSTHALDVDKKQDILNDVKPNQVVVDTQTEPDQNMEEETIQKDPSGQVVENTKEVNEVAKKDYQNEEKKYDSSLDVEQQGSVSTETVVDPDMEKDYYGEPQKPQVDQSYDKQTVNEVTHSDSLEESTNIFRYSSNLEEKKTLKNSKESSYLSSGKTETTNSGAKVTNTGYRNNYNGETKLNLFYQSNKTPETSVGMLVIPNEIASHFDNITVVDSDGGRIDGWGGRYVALTDQYVPLTIQYFTSPTTLYLVGTYADGPNKGQSVSYPILEITQEMIDNNQFQDLELNYPDAIREVNDAYKKMVEMPNSKINKENENYDNKLLATVGYDQFGEYQAAYYEYLLDQNKANDVQPYLVPSATPYLVPNPVPNPVPVATPVKVPTKLTNTDTTTSPEVTSPEVTTPEVTSPEVTTPEVTTPEVTSPEVTTPEVTTPEVTPTSTNSPVVTNVVNTTKPTVETQTTTDSAPEVDQEVTAQKLPNTGSGAFGVVGEALGLIAASGAALFASRKRK